MKAHQTNQAAHRWGCSSRGLGSNTTHAHTPSNHAPLFMLSAANTTKGTNVVFGDAVEHNRHDAACMCMCGAVKDVNFQGLSRTTHDEHTCTIAFFWYMCMSSSSTLWLDGGHASWRQPPVKLTQSVGSHCGLKGCDWPMTRQDVVRMMACARPRQPPQACTLSINVHVTHALQEAGSRKQRAGSSVQVVLQACSAHVAQKRLNKLTRASHLPSIHVS